MFLQVISLVPILRGWMLLGGSREGIFDPPEEVTLLAHTPALRHWEPKQRKLLEYAQAETQIPKEGMLAIGQALHSTWHPFSPGVVEPFLA